MNDPKSKDIKIRICPTFKSWSSDTLRLSNQDARMASNDDVIEWQANTFDTVIDINIDRILMIFASF